MKSKEIFQSLLIPAPPDELREKVMAQAFTSHQPTLSHSWVNSLWESRSVRYAWSLSTVAALLFLIFWNPPMPGINPENQIHQISDKGEISLPGNNGPLRSSMTQMRTSHSLRSLQGEDL